MQKAVFVNYVEPHMLIESMNRVLQQNADRRIENIFPIIQGKFGTGAFLVLLSDLVEGASVTEEAGETEHQKADHQNPDSMFN